MGEFEMSGSTCLVPFIDNGGQRSFVERRQQSNICYLRDRRSRKERRMIVDRREIPNQERRCGPERRAVFQK
jgi:hypothetical protein